MQKRALCFGLGVLLAVAMLPLGMALEAARQPPQELVTAALLAELKEYADFDRDWGTALELAEWWREQEFPEVATRVGAFEARVIRKDGAQWRAEGAGSDGWVVAGEAGESPGLTARSAWPVRIEIRPHTLLGKLMLLLGE